MHPLIAALYAASLQLTAGSLLAAAIVDWRAEVTPGFLRLAALVALSGAAVAWLLAGGADSRERIATLGLLALTLIFTVLQVRSLRAPRLAAGAAATLAGIATVLLAFWARPSPLLDYGWLALAALAATVALGASTMALVLGHWYLVTPRLSPRPLRLLCDLTIGSLLVLSGFACWYFLAHPGAAPIGPDDPLFRWAGLLAITLFPLGVTVAARLCCQEWPRGRAIQAATGLLYIVAALVMAGALAANVVLMTPVGSRQ